MPRAKNTKTSSKSAAKPTIISRAEPREIRDFVPDVHEQIRVRAYELWEQRGRQYGNPEEDWLRAEQEVLARTEKTA